MSQPDAHHEPTAYDVRAMAINQADHAAINQPSRQQHMKLRFRGPAQYSTRPNTQPMYAGTTSRMD
jgi:hypothetical protein